VLAYVAGAFAIDLMTYIDTAGVRAFAELALAAVLMRVGGEFYRRRWTRPIPKPRPPYELEDQPLMFTGSTFPTPLGPPSPYELHLINKYGSFRRCREGYDLCIIRAGHPGWCEVADGFQDSANDVWTGRASAGYDHRR